MYSSISTTIYLYVYQYTNICVCGNICISYTYILMNSYTSLLVGIIHSLTCS